MPTKSSVIETLHAAMQEIDNMRRINEILRAKAEVIDTFTKIANGMHQPDRGFGIDVRWQIHTMIESLKEAVENQNAEKENNSNTSMGREASSPEQTIQKAAASCGLNDAANRSNGNKKYRRVNNSRRRGNASKKRSII